MIILHYTFLLIFWTNLLTSFKYSKNSFFILGYTFFILKKITITGYFSLFTMKKHPFIKRKVVFSSITNSILKKIGAVVIPHWSYGNVIHKYNRINIQIKL